MTSINIPESVTAIGQGAFGYCSSLNSINIPHGVTSIGKYAFLWCSSLTSINVPDGVTSIEDYTFENCSSLSSLTIPTGVISIGKWAFAYCDSLATINIPDGVTSIGHGAFSICPSLVAINLPDGLTSIEGHTFVGCSNLTSISIPEGVISIGDHAFYNCSRLSDINIPEGITSIEDYIFYGCNSLNEIKLPEGITSIGDNAFDGCSSLTSINIPDGVSLIGQKAFSGCSSLISLILSEGVTSIKSSTFSGCSSLTSIRLPEGITSIGYDAFYGCSSITSINIPAGVTLIEISAFMSCNKLEEVTYTATTPIEAHEYVFGSTTYNKATLKTPNATLASVQATVPWNKFQKIEASDGSIGMGLAAGEDFEYQGIWYTVLDADAKTCQTKNGNFNNGKPNSGNNCSGEITIPSVVSDGTNNYTVISIGEYAFSNCSELISIILPESVNSINWNAFENCSSLISIDIPNAVTSIGKNAFYNCSSLTSINIPTSVTSIEEYCFYGCSSLTSINISEGVTSIGESAFSGCFSLPSITLPETLISIGRSAFESCKSLISIDIPNGVTSIPWGAFYYCTGLTSVNIPNGVTSIGAYAFDGCTNLISINIPAGVTSIEPFTFYVCYSLTSITIPNGVTSIGSYAFGACISLTSINIPESVAEIEEKAFIECDNLKEISYYASIPIEAPENVFGETTYAKAILTTPNSSLSAVQATMPWNKFTKIIANDGSIGMVINVEGITISMSLAELKVGESMTLNATVLPEDATDKTITWSTSKPDIATVDAEGKVTAIALGEATVKATCGEVSATCSVSVVPTPVESISISQTSAELIVGESLSLSATVLPEDATDKTITWTSSNPEIATVDAEGKVTAVALGEAVITSTCGEVSATCSVSVVPTPIESISLSQESAQLKVGEYLTLSATVLPEEATDKIVTWSSSNPDIATVDSEGKLTAIALGEATITATCGEVSATCAVSVVPTPVASISISQESAQLKVGESVTLTATIHPEDATDKTITWTSDNPNIATVDAEGKVTAIALGEATITATCGEVSATCAVSVVATPVESISLNQESAQLKVGESLTLTATVLPEDATDKTVTWNSSNPEIATVDAEGKVTAIALGEAVITATCGEVSVTCKVSVVATPVESISLRQETAQLKVGESVTLSATVLPEDATDKTVTWSTSNPDIATVDAEGNVTAISLGDAVITATCGEVTASCAVSVVATQVESISLSQESAQLKVGESLSLNATVLPEDATDKTITWTSSNPEIATVDSEGKVIAIALGESTITATCGEVTASCAVSIVAKPVESISLNQESAQLKVGESVVLTATVLQEDATDKTITWISGNPEIATVDSVGKMTAIALGEAVITATCGEVSATCSVTVVKTPVNSITISQESAKLKVGESVTLSATVLPEDATDKTITWTSSNPDIASVDAEGNVTAILAGETSIMATCGNISAACLITVIDDALHNGDDFEYQGIWYTVLDADAKTVKTKDGYFDLEIGADVPGNSCTGDILIPSIVSDGKADYAVKAIGYYAFTNCSELTSINLPESLDSIGSYAFFDCSRLSNFTIPSKVTSIGKYAFLRCRNLEEINYYASTPIEAPENVFDSATYAAAILNTPNAPIEAVQSTVPWSLFQHVIASNGSVGIGLSEGEQFSVDGVTYTVIDEENHRVETADGIADGEGANNYTGDLVISSPIVFDNVSYDVTEIGDYSFSGSDYLTSVTIPGSVENIGEGAFSDCERLTSIIWQGSSPLQNGVVESIGNPNLLVYVDSISCAPNGLDHNIVIMNTADGIPTCDHLILEQGYAFHPAIDFISLNSRLAHEYTQTTIIGETSGWETIVLPFDVKGIQREEITENSAGIRITDLTPFAAVTDLDTQYPFWLYEADANGEWKEASEIKAGIPYIISMPNNPDYVERFNVNGLVSFSSSEPSYITGEIASPYIVTWASGQDFSSMWLPLDAAQAANAMGLNVGMDHLTDDEGTLLPPGSAFFEGVTPRPLEAYVTREGAERFKRVMGDPSRVLALEAPNGLEILSSDGKLFLRSDADRKIDIYAIDGIHVRSIILSGGKTETLRDLTPGLYLIAGRKVLIK